MLSKNTNLKQHKSHHKTWQRHALSAVVIMSFAFLAACSNSNRIFDPRTPASNKPPRQAQNSAIYNAPSDDIVTAQAPSGGYAGVATGTIVAEPLAPPTGAAQAVAPQSLPQNPTQPPLLAPTTGAQTNVPTLTPSSGQGRQVADLRPATEQVAPRSAASGGSVLGSWAAKDATGARCKVQLSSAPAVDLYKASASGCPNKDLAKITAWDQRDGEIYLYQPGGTIAARLRPSGTGYEGVMTKSSAAISLAR